MKSRLRILPDGREITSGYQWEKRKKELRERAGGWCEAGEEFPLLLHEAPLIEGHPNHFIGDDGDPHHVIKRSKARDDRLQNLRWICHAAHQEIHGRVF